VLVNVAEGAARLSNELMGLLASVPNLLILISCMQDKWKDFIGKTNKAFQDRTRHVKLDTLAPEQASDLIARRLRTWAGARTSHSATWPFDEASIHQLARDVPWPAMSPSGHAL
jgi:hypothetical protein